MTEDELDEEYDSIEYALKHLSLIVNELEDLDYWKNELYDLENFREKLENRQLELDALYEGDIPDLERDLFEQDMRYQEELDRRWGI